LSGGKTVINETRKVRNAITISTLKYLIRGSFLEKKKIEKKIIFCISKSIIVSVSKRLDMNGGKNFMHSISTLTTELRLPTILTSSGVHMKKKMKIGK